MPRRQPREGVEQDVQPLAAQQPARVDDERAVSRQAQALALARALLWTRRGEASGIDRVRYVDGLGLAHARPEQLAPDLLRDRDPGVGIPHQRVPQRHGRAHQSAHARLVGGRAPGVDLPGHFAVHLGLEHDALAQRARHQQPGQAEHARARHHQHVVAGALARQRRKRRGHHRVLAAPAGPGRRDAQHAHAVQRLLGGPARVAAPGHDGRRETGRRQAAAHLADVALAAPEHGMERLGQVQDAGKPHRRGSA